ncbi:unnamed protein product [Fusarium venenatum]|uniref:Uncharacterized protein n=1 Tax=Fusarium venenatum TaxID=56646 RepID=A0A2L2TT65_9HYPO|nr:uncharacterized protein FVRRES_09648 [Fusarium venenatum]CEI69571.1 unnamed protein product [Fusarium venenatum]
MAAVIMELDPWVGSTTGSACMPVATYSNVNNL